MSVLQLSAPPSRRLARPSAPQLLTALLWALLAGSAVFWGLRLFSKGEPVPAHAQVVGLEPSAAADARRLFGQPRMEAAQPSAVQASSRFKLSGVVAGATPDAAGAVATLSVDGGPTRAYRVGAVVDGEWVLQAITPRGVQIGPRVGPAAVVLELPGLPAASVGRLPAASLTNVGPGVAAPAVANVSPGGVAPLGAEQSAGVASDMPPLMMEPPAAGPQGQPARAVQRGVSASAAR